MPSDQRRPDSQISTAGPRRESLRVHEAVTVTAPSNAVSSRPERDDVLFGHSDRYRPGEVLGRGGMGEVRLYKDDRIGREVAIKRLHEKSEAHSEEWRRFVREARVQGQLEHPAVVPVYDFGIGDQGEAYFSMRRVQGESLADVLDRLEDRDPAAIARWSRRRLLGAFVQVCLAVDYAHSRGVVHRDLKPGNIMLGDFGEVQVIDWGLALVLTEDAEPRAASARIEKPLDNPDAEKLTHEGTVMGTPGYMSPEQMGLHDVPVGPATDVFALGMILYEILTYHAYHRRRRFPEIFLLTRMGYTVSPAEGRDDVPAELDAICRRGTALAAADRYASARELADAVEGYLDSELDRARRRDLASEHGRLALASADSVSNTDEAQRQRNALREALSALALDPSQREAREVLARLLGELPEKLPVPVQAEIESALQDSRRRSVHNGFLTWVGWLVSAPLVLLLGVRSWLVWITGTAICAVAALYSLWLRRQAAIDGVRGAIFVLFFPIMLMLYSAWLGPFVFVPAVTSIVLLFSVTGARPRERPFLMAISIATVAIPWLLELAHVVPPSMAITPEGVTLFPRAFDTRPLPTTAALLWTSLSFIVVPIRLLNNMRDALARAERRLALHAWQLRQLVD